MLTVKPPGWHKPFHLFPYHNKPKPDPYRSGKRIKYNKEPKIPVHLNHAAQLKFRNTKELLQQRSKLPMIRPITTVTMETASRTPAVLPKSTKTYQYRFKLGRAIPVVSSRFTEHAMTFKKPPFRHVRKDTCTHFKIHSRIVSIKKQNT